MIRLLLLWLLLWPASQVRAECAGPFKGRTPTAEQLQEVLAAHKAWVEAKPEKSSWDEYLKNSGTDTKRANLCRAELSVAHLSKSDLRGAELSGAMLIGADLSGAILNDAILIDARLQMASLIEAMLVDTYLNKAILIRTNLSRADLREAHLNQARLDESDLSGAQLWGADVDQVLFSPQTGKLPDIPGFAYARNLDRMRTWPNSLPVLAEYREAFRKAGFREAERAMTYLVKRQQEAFEAPEERWFSRIFFDWPSAYGLHPGWALLIMAGLAGLLSLVYLVALVRSDGGGIWAVWSADRLNKSEGQGEPVRLSFARPFPPSAPPPAPGRDPLAGLRPPPQPAGPSRAARIRRFFILALQAWGIALYFSVLSAFHFGWRDLNVGNWIARVQPREYALRPSGWVRVVSGVQSLVSVYLVALWALTYFGRPFE